MGDEKFNITEGLTKLLFKPWQDFTDQEKNSLTDDDMKSYAAMLKITNLNVAPGKNQKIKFVLKTGFGLQASKSAPQGGIDHFQLAKSANEALAAKRKNQKIFIKKKSSSANGIQSETFGSLWVDIKQLNQGKLVAKNKNGTVKISKKIDPPFIKLLTERYNSSFPYTKQAIELYRKLIKVSQYKLSPRSTKHKLVYTSIAPVKGNGCEPIVYKTPNDLVKRFSILVGSQQAGNNNPKLYNEAVRILDELLKLKHVSKDEYKQLIHHLAFGRTR